jgi:hypothetical protein
MMQVLTRRSPDTDDKSEATVKKQQRSMRELAPFVDEYGLLRVGGRLQRAGFAYEKTHPLIIPRRHDLTKLLVHHFHEQSGHQGYNYVLAQLRDSYWVIGGTGTVRHYLGTCVACRNDRAKFGQQQMAPLPASRFAVGHPAFAYTAVDYFGPLRVRVKRSTEKRWGCLFTCLTTRAVQLEVAHSLSADSFLMAFRRFTSANPGVKEMLSDNGTNFCAGDALLRREFAEGVELPYMADKLLKDGIDFRWKFNPPAASHQGGVFERLIRTVRSCLRQTAKDMAFRTPRQEELDTVMKGIEGIMNLRPLLPAGIDPNSYDVISPAQILRPGMPAAPQQSRQFTAADQLKQGYRSSQRHVDEFWKRFVSHYIPMLQKRAKWLQPERNFQVGDLVLIRDKDMPRNRWRKGLVAEVHPNQVDGLVRRVTVRQPTGQMLNRDVRYLCLLEASPQLEINQSEAQGKHKR